VSHRLTEEDKLTNYPYRDAEASASHDLLRLKAFVDDLQNLFDKQGEPRTLDDWKKLFVEEVMEKMVWSDDFSKEDRNERNEIYRALGFTDRLPPDVADKAVPWPVFVNELNKRLFTESREHALNSGAITFTSAIPSRGLPYKVIAFIGLDNGVFPRQDQHLGFDLMGNDYQPGDRSKKEADKSLFLDTLMSAREKLYLSHIGQSVKDNTEIPPSILLDTLMDYLDLKPTEHPLHGFSNRYQKEDKKLFTYLYNTEPDPNVHKTKGAETASDPEKTEHPKEEIWANDFVKFFEAPIDWFFKKVLGIYLDGDDDDTLPETELFELNALQQWGFKNELLKLKESSAEELDALLQKFIKECKLPLKNLGRATLEKLQEEIKPIEEKLKEETKNKTLESKLADIEIENIRIRGEFENVYSGKIVSWAFSDGQKYELRGFLASLLLSFNGQISSAVHIKKDGNVKVIQVMKGDEPSDRLKKLLGYLEQGKKAPLKFSLGAAKAIKDQDINDEKTLKKALEAFRKEAYKLYEDDTENKYTQVLFDEGYFDDLSREDLKEIQELAGLLNLYA
jgi:exodeoxyribonuclease V gamma subunit